MKKWLFGISEQPLNMALYKGKFFQLLIFHRERDATTHHVVGQWLHTL